MTPPLPSWIVTTDLNLYQTVLDLFDQNDRTTILNRDLTPNDSLEKMIVVESETQIIDQIHKQNPDLFGYFANAQIATFW